MGTTTTTEAKFLELNDRRLSALKGLLKAAERATQLCNVWLKSGHVAAYRAWQTQLWWLEETDRQYRDIPAPTAGPFSR